jgi:hypothetical protein
MSQERFSVWRREGVARGQRRLADTVRLLIYKADPDLFGLLDYDMRTTTVFSIRCCSPASPIRPPRATSRG